MLDRAHLSQTWTVAQIMDGTTPDRRHGKPVVGMYATWCSFPQEIHAGSCFEKPQLHQARKACGFELNIIWGVYYVLFYLYTPCILQEVMRL